MESTVIPESRFSLAQSEVSRALLMPDATDFCVQGSQAYLDRGKGMEAWS